MGKKFLVGGGRAAANLVEPIVMRLWEDFSGEYITYQLIELDYQATIRLGKF